MSKQAQIRLKHKSNGVETEYTLCYTRDSIVKMEAMGFNIDDLKGKMATNIPLLIRGAFIEKHSRMRQEEIDKIMDTLKNKNGLIEALSRMLLDCYVSLSDDGDGEKNATWEEI